MATEISYKMKYQNMKAKFMESVDLAFRLGFEQGQQKAAQDQMAQQQQQAELQAAQAAQGGQPGQPGQDPSQDPSQGASATADGQDPGQQNPMGSELDQHLNELEGLLGKSEISQDDMKKAIGAIKASRDLKKSHEAIKGIALALHKPAYKMSVQASHNLTNTAKRSLKMQQEIVSDVFKSWEEEEKNAQKSIASTLEVEGLIKK